MESHSRTTNANSVTSSPGRILRNSRTPAGVTHILQDPEREDHLAALRVTNLRQISTIQAPQDVALDVSEEKEIEKEL